MKHALILIFLLGWLLGCAPSEAAIQTAISKKRSNWSAFSLPSSFNHKTPTLLE